jgi:hypothetical protein
MNGYSCFGKYLKTPQFTDIPELVGRIERLPLAAERPVAIGQPHPSNPQMTVFRQHQDFKATVRAGDLLKLDLAKILGAAETRRQKEAELKAKAAKRAA